MLLYSGLSDIDYVKRCVKKSGDGGNIEAYDPITEYGIVYFLKFWKFGADIRHYIIQIIV